MNRFMIISGCTRAYINYIMHVKVKVRAYILPGKQIPSYKKFEVYFEEQRYTQNDSCLLF